MNEQRIADQLRRINSQVGSGQLTEQQIRDQARQRAERTAERAAREEK